MQLRTELAEAFTELQNDTDLEIGVFAGTGRAFCAGEAMKESLPPLMPVLYFDPGDSTRTQCSGLKRS